MVHKFVIKHKTEEIYIRSEGKISTIALELKNASLYPTKAIAQYIRTRELPSIIKNNAHLVRERHTKNDYHIVPVIIALDIDRGLVE